VLRAVEKWFHFGLDELTLLANLPRGKTFASGRNVEMLSTRSPFEFEPVVTPEPESPCRRRFDSDAEGARTPVTEEWAVEGEPSFEEGALGLGADAARKQDEDDDSDFGFDDFDYDDDDSDEDEGLDDDFDEEDDELDEDLDELEDSDEP
jgi:hypothetical protein